MHRPRTMAAALFGIAFVVPSVLAGDPTPPPGPVSATMKTLTEVEPRIAVNDVNTPGDASALFVIFAPGSYYLTEDILGVSGKHGIRILSADVTLDLNGFELRGVAGTLDGVNTNALYTGITVRNGSVREWGRHGVYLKSDCGVVENLRVHGNNQWGIDMSGSWGGRIFNCTSFENGAEVFANGGGIKTGQGFVVEGCAAYSNSGYGIYLQSYTVVRACSAVNTIEENDTSQNGSGIYVSSQNCVVESSTSCANDGHGIHLGNFSSLARGCVADGNALTNMNYAGSSQALDCVAP